MSPATIITGMGTPDKTAMRLEFGSYVQVSAEDCDPSNTPRAHDSLNAITIAPTRTGNTQDEDSTLCPKHRVPVFPKTNGSNYPYRTPPLRGLKHLHLPKANPSFRRRAVWLSNGVVQTIPLTLSNNMTAITNPRRILQRRKTSYPVTAIPFLILIGLVAHEDDTPDAHDVAQDQDKRTTYQ